jgi:hypothetical protein
MTSFKGKASWAKITSLGGKPTALVYLLTKKVNKAEKLAYLSVNIGVSQSIFTPVRMPQFTLVNFSIQLTTDSMFI